MRVKVKNDETFAQAIREFCAFLESENVPPENIFDSRLVVSELLGNVLRHAKGTADLHSEVKDGFVELKIISQDVYFPKEVHCAEAFSEHGRGLFLVKNVCEESIFMEEDGLRVRIRIEKKEI